jgi:hypothetical protein
MVEPTPQYRLPDIDEEFFAPDTTMIQSYTQPRLVPGMFHTPDYVLHDMIQWWAADGDIDPVLTPEFLYAERQRRLTHLLTTPLRGEIVVDDVALSPRTNRRIPPAVLAGCVGNIITAIEVTDQSDMRISIVPTVSDSDRTARILPIDPYTIFTKQSGERLLTIGESVVMGASSSADYPRKIRSAHTAHLTAMQNGYQGGEALDLLTRLRQELHDEAA